MRTLTRNLLVLVVLLGWTASSNAGLIQNLNFYIGSDPTVAPVQSARIVFPQELGCISGTSFFLPPLDCAADTPFPADTNVPGDISITSTLGVGTFNVGVWNIDIDGFLHSFISFTAGGFEIGVPVNEFYPNATDPIGTIGTSRIRNIATGEESFLGVLATPVPIPSTLLLMSLGLLGFWMSAGKKSE